MEVCFGARLRGEQKFRDSGKLSAQIQCDLKEARYLFKAGKAGF